MMQANYNIRFTVPKDKINQNISTPLKKSLH
jgi:hypothetical protein